MSKLTILTILTASLLTACGSRQPPPESVALAANAESDYLPYIERSQVATATATVALPRPTLGPTCEVKVAGADKRHIWHMVAELEYLGFDAYLTGVRDGTEIGLGVSARQPVCDVLATLYRGAGFDVEVWP